MKQNTLKANPGSRKRKMRVGRGGNKGTYSGRGMKGQNARTGGGVRPGFEGGQTPLLRRMPKMKGFKNPNKVHYFALNVSRIDSIYKDGETVDVKSLIEKGVLKKATAIKVLGNGEISKKVKVSADLASKSAIAKIEKAGGSVEVLNKKEESKES